MQRSAKPTQDAKKVAKQWPEFQGEKRVSIGDY